MKEMAISLICTFEILGAFLDACVSEGACAYAFVCAYACECELKFSPSVEVFNIECWAHENAPCVKYTRATDTHIKLRSNTQLLDFALRALGRRNIRR